MYRLARKPWSSDGKKGFLAVRTGKGMEGLHEKLHYSALGFAGWNYSLTAVGTYSRVTVGTQERMFWTFPLPSV